MCVRLGMSQIQIHRTLSAAYGQNALSKTQIWMWYHRFQEDPDRSCQDLPHLGQLCSARTQANQDEVMAEVNQDCWKSIKSISAAVGTSWSTTQRILNKDLGMTHRAVKFIPRVLTEQQKRTRMQICQSNLDLIQRDAMILDRIVTTDESWVFKLTPTPSKPMCSGFPRIPRGTQKPSDLDHNRNACFVCSLMPDE